jgi:hypothetical protein
MTDASFGTHSQDRVPAYHTLAGQAVEPVADEETSVLTGSVNESSCLKEQVQMRAVPGNSTS